MPNDHENPFANIPLHHLLFLKIRDGGGPKIAHSVADSHEISVDDLKAACKKAGEEIIQERGHLLVYEQPVYDWANS